MVMGWCVCVCGDRVVCADGVVVCEHVLVIYIGCDNLIVCIVQYCLD